MSTYRLRVKGVQADASKTGQWIAITSPTGNPALPVYVSSNNSDIASFEKGFDNQGPDFSSAATAGGIVAGGGFTSAFSVPNGTSTIRLLIDETAIELDGVPTDILDLPAGFTPSSATLQVLIASIPTGGSSPSSGEFYLYYDPFTVSSNKFIEAEGSGAGVTDLQLSFLHPWTFPTPTILDLVDGGLGVKIVNPGGGDQNLGIWFWDAYITGSYTIESFSWWFNPDTDHYQFSDDPGDPWVAQDPDLTLISVTPDHGPSGGGDFVTLVGTGFGDGASVTFDGTPATDVTVITETTITCTTPAHAAGLVDVTVINPDFESATLTDGYEYVIGGTVTAEAIPDITFQIDPDVDAFSTLFGLVAEDPALGENVTGTWTQIDGPDTAVIDSPTATDLDSVSVDSNVTFPSPGTYTFNLHGEGVSGDIGDAEATVTVLPSFWWDNLEFGWHFFGPPPPHIPFQSLGDVPFPSFDWSLGSEPSDPNGWFLSPSAYGGDDVIVSGASARPVDPRTWTDFNFFATGSADMLGGSPNGAAVSENHLIFPAHGYNVGTEYPPIHIFDGFSDYLLCRLPPTSASAVPKAVCSMLAANGTVYVSTIDTGTSSSDWVGRVFSLDIKSATLTPIGTPFPTGHVPYALGFHNGRLWCGTHRQSATAVGKIFWFRPDIDTVWTDDYTLSSSSVTGAASMVSFQGNLYVGTTNAAASRGKILKRTPLGVWSTVDTGSGGTATANNGFISMAVFEDHIYAAYWNDDTVDVSFVRKSADGTTWSTAYTGTGVTLRPFIGMHVDGDNLFLIGGGHNLSAAVVRTDDGTTWTDLTAQLPQSDATALPIFGTVIR